MAEAVTLVVYKLIPLITQEANLLKGVRGKVKSIKDELDSVVSFLVEADAREARGESNENIRTWVKQVRDLAHDIEDVIDDYTYLVARRRQKQGVSKFLKKFGIFIKKLAVHHEIASKIEKIKKDVLEIKSRTDRYGLILSTKGSLDCMPKVTDISPIQSLFIPEAELVGIERPKNLLKSWLNDDGKRKRMVISVVGMGGLGKTTLVRKVYDSHIDQFDCYAWITVSQTFFPKELLKSIIRQFYQAQKESAPPSTETMDEIELIKELCNYVDKKRYIIVFDDVWSRPLCENMIHALPENCKCSRILFTTRSEDVAPSEAQSSLNRVYKLPLLPFEKSFQLFCKKVFQSLNCPQELEKLSREIVKKCDGLPLAIVAVGGILSRKKKNVPEWKKFQNSLLSKLQSDEQMTRVNKILSLSIHNLSPNLKSCLLYFGIYPEDFSIRCSRLIRQWIAEGFVRVEDNEELEDVAEDYLSELIHRSVIQVSKVDPNDKVRECRVHDFMLEIIVLKSKEMRYCSTIGEDDDGRPRRLSMVRNDPSTGGFPSDTIPLVRSLFVFHNSTFSKKMFENMRLLKMLDFEGSQVIELSECVGDLYLLSYLSVRKTEVELLPKSVGKLEQLETLDFKESRIRKLPFEIKRLRKLRHLLGYSYNEANVGDSLDYRQGVKIQGGLKCWETLRKLCYVEANSGATLQELIKFKKLRKLGITRVRREDATQLCTAIENMKELRSLEIKVIDKKQAVDLESIDSPPPLLRTLSLIGGLEALPRWITKLQNIVGLHLSSSGLANDPLESLQDLPNLLDLAITDDGCKSDRLRFQRGGFPKLKSLRLSDLKLVKELIIERGALPCLKHMVIGPFSPEMMEVPSGIKHLSGLEFLLFVDFSEEFYKKMVSSRLSWRIIECISTVQFGLRCSTGKYEYFTPATYKDRKVND